VDGFVETLYESFKAGESVTLPGLGGFYLRQEPESWVFKFNPAQRLRALFGWSSTRAFPNWNNSSIEPNLHLFDK
jgi:nucleoid DNA-binding protein